MLQIALVMIACFNVWFIIEAKIEYRIFRGHIKVFAFAYLVCNICVTAIKLYLTCYAIITATFPSWAKTPTSGGQVPGQTVDYIWMVFNAVLPFIFSFVRSRSENPLKITIDLQALPRNELVENEEDQIDEEAAVMFPPRRNKHEAARPRIMRAIKKSSPVRRMSNHIGVGRSARVKRGIARPPLSGACMFVFHQNVYHICIVLTDRTCGIFCDVLQSIYSQELIQITRSRMLFSKEVERKQLFTVEQSRLLMLLEFCHILSDLPELQQAVQLRFASPWV